MSRLCGIQTCYSCLTLMSNMDSYCEFRAYVSIFKETITGRQVVMYDAHASMLR